LQQHNRIRSLRWRWKIINFEAHLYPIATFAINNNRLFSGMYTYNYIIHILFNNAAIELKKHDAQ
jgi:hypothetical protein